MPAVSYVPFAEFCDGCPNWQDDFVTDLAGGLKGVVKRCTREINEENFFKHGDKIISHYGAVDCWSCSSFRGNIKTDEEMQDALKRKEEQ